MPSLAFILVFSLSVLAASGQDVREGRNFQPYPVPGASGLKSSVKLPAKVNLAKSKYFPDIFDQFGWSCNQSSSVGYLLTYELNRLRNADGGLPENRYPPLFVWNFLNSARYGNGVSYFDSWEIVKAAGTPNETDYPNHADLQFWMSGYDLFARAMQNRVVNNWSLPVGTPEGLQMLKRYLYDHFDGSKFGGMANFQIASGGMSLGKLPLNSYDEGAAYITTFGTYVGHALTVVGYNDSIRMDRNSDGEYTNTIDIDGDHLVDLNDFEKGALIVANTWGKSWGDNGFAYVPYHLLGRYGNEGGIWNKSVHIVDAVKSVEPILTLRAELTHNCRNAIRLMAGVANDPNATEPEFVLGFPMFNYQGSDLPLLANGVAGATRFEVGLDISPLIDYINTDGPVKIFLAVDERDSWGRNDGVIRSMMVYNHFITRDSTISEESMVAIRNNSRTLLSVVRPVRFNRIAITEIPKIYTKAGTQVSVQMNVTGAASPYSWELVPDYRAEFTKEEIPDYGGDLLYNGQFGNPVSRVDLPFKFHFFGEEYDHFLVTEDAEILFDQEESGYPYVIDPDLVFQSVRKINGFGTDLDYYMEGNTITCYQTDTLAAITWKAIAPSPEGGVAVVVVCVIHPDGRIRFYYDKPDVLFPSGATGDLGVSNGDNRMYRRIALFNPDGLIGANSMKINPFLCPEETKFDGTGWLFCKPEKPDALYEVKIRVVDKNNRMAYAVVQIATRDLASMPLLPGNYPNPFRDETHVRIVVPEKAAVTAEIYDIQGRKVAVLLSGEQEPAEYAVSWNGYGADGVSAGPGVYFCRLRVGDKVASCKMVKLAR
jgi:hypothetical protein